MIDPQYLAQMKDERLAEDAPDVTLATSGRRDEKQVQEALPSPATHAILTVLKAGESVFQTTY